MVFSSVPSWLDVVAYAYIVSAVACSLVIVYDIVIRGHRQMMPIMAYVWPITSLYLNLFGAWAYWKMGRPDSMKHSQMPMEGMQDMQGTETEPVQTRPIHHRQKRFWLRNRGFRRRMAGVLACFKRRTRRFAALH